MLMIADLFQTEKDRIFKQVSVYSMTMDHPQPHPNRRNALLMESFTFKRVSRAQTHACKIVTNASFTAEEANRTFSTLLRHEIFDTTIPQPTPPDLSPDPARLPSSHTTTVHDPTRSHTPPNNSSNTSLPTSMTPSTPHKNLFTYMSPRHHTNIAGHPTPSRTPQSRHGPHLDSRSELYSLSPVRLGSQQMLLSPRKQPRAVSKVPYKVLDAQTQIHM